MRLPLIARWFVKAHATLYSLSNGKIATTMRGHPVAAMPGFGDYQKKTTRVIPIVQLVRA